MENTFVKYQDYLRGFHMVDGKNTYIIGIPSNWSEQDFLKLYNIKVEEGKRTKNPIKFGMGYKADDNVFVFVCDKYNVENVFTFLDEAIETCEQIAKREVLLALKMNELKHLFVEEDSLDKLQRLTFVFEESKRGRGRPPKINETSFENNHTIESTEVLTEEIIEENEEN